MGDLNMPLKVVLQAKRQPTYITGISDAFMLDSDMVVEIALGLTGEGALIAGVQGVRVSELQVVRQALVRFGYEVALVTEELFVSVVVVHVVTQPVSPLKRGLAFCAL